MIEIEGYSFNGKVKMFWPIAEKIESLTSKQINENMLGGVTECYTEYKKLPDPDYMDLSHVIRKVKAIAPDTIEVTGQFLETRRGKQVLDMFNKSPNLVKGSKLFPNMYGLAARKADGSPDIEKETVCTIDILLNNEDK